MAHIKTDVVRTYTFSPTELRERLGIGGDISSLELGGILVPGDTVLVIRSTMVHPEDARSRNVDPGAPSMQMRAGERA